MSASQPFVWQALEMNNKRWHHTANPKLSHISYVLSKVHYIMWVLQRLSNCILHFEAYHINSLCLSIFSWRAFAYILQRERLADCWRPRTQRSNPGRVPEQRSCCWCGLPLPAAKSLLDRHNPKQGKMDDRLTTTVLLKLHIVAKK